MRKSLAAHRVRIRVLGFLRFFLSKSRCLQFLSSFRVLLVCKVEPEKSLLHFFVSCIFSHSCPQICTIIRLFGQGLSCILSCIFPKKSPFLPQNEQFCLFSYLHCFLVSGQYFRYKHRPKSADKPACISLGYHHIAFSMINSKSIWQQCHVGSNPTVCAKYHYSILHWVVIFYCRFAKFRMLFFIGISLYFQVVIFGFGTNHTSNRGK